MISAAVSLAAQIAVVRRWMDKTYFPDKLIRNCREFRQDDKRFLQYARKLRRERRTPNAEMNAYFQQCGDMANQFRGGVFLLKLEVIFNTVFHSLLMGLVAAFPVEICRFLSNLSMIIFSVPLEIPPLILLIIACPVIMGELLYTFWQNWNVKYRQNLTVLLDGYTAFLDGFEMRVKESSPSPAAVKKRQPLSVALGALTYAWAFAATVALVYGSRLTLAYMLSKPSLAGLLLYYVSSPWNLLSVFCALAAFGCFKFQEFLFGSGYDSPEGRFREWRGFRQKKPPCVAEALKPWERDCIKMCQTLRVYGVFIQAEALQTGIAYANRLPSGKINVYFNSACLQSWKTDYDMVKFILAHELAHISAGDLVNRSARISALICLLLWIAPLLILGAYLPVSPGVWAFLAAYGLFVKIMAVDTFTDERFWGQIKELRADRTGTLVSGVSMETFRNSVQAEWSFGAAEKVRRHEKAEVEPDAHPSPETRIRELERHYHQPWKAADSLRYAVEYWRKLRLSKEWRL